MPPPPPKNPSSSQAKLEATTPDESLETHRVCEPVAGDTAQCTLYRHPSLVIEPASLVDATAVSSEKERVVDIPEGATMGISRETAGIYVLQGKKKPPEREAGSA